MSHSLLVRNLTLTLGSAALVFAGALEAHASPTRVFVIDDAEALAAGETDGATVRSDGVVVRGTHFDRVELAGVSVAYSSLALADGSILVGTADQGRIYKLKNGESSVFSETHTVLVASLALGPNGIVYAGTLPEGKVFSVDAAGAATELAKLEGAQHVWSLAWSGTRNTLFAGTGPEGKVFAVTPAGQATLWYDAEASHIMSLGIEPGGSVLAGTSDKALLFRLRSANQAEVVFDFPGNELTALTIHQDGSIAVTANELPDPPSAPAAAATPPASSPPARPRAGKGRLWRIGTDGRSEQIFAREDGHFSSLWFANDGSLFVGLGIEGRIYRVLADRSWSTYADFDERQVVSLGGTGSIPSFALTSDGAAVYRPSNESANPGTWTSKVQDASSQGRFGAVTWRAVGSVRFQTRSGNTEEPNATWSEWSAPLTSPGPIRSASARYLQLRATLGADATLYEVEAYYLPQNQRAYIKELTVKSKRTSSDTPAAGEAPRAPTGMAVAWKVDNVDNDSLRYRLWFRQERQTAWRPMLAEQETLTRAEYTWDTNVIPDGIYVLRVQVSDELANADPYALVSEAQSEPVLIDNTPPALSLELDHQTLKGHVTDALGPISRIEYTSDGRSWRPLLPVDDLLDTNDERFELPVGALNALNGIVAVRAFDAADNSATAEVNLPQPRPGSHTQR